MLEVLALEQRVIRPDVWYVVYRMSTKVTLALYSRVYIVNQTAVGVANI